MTTINIFKKNGQVNKIIIKGHTGYDLNGRDIICSSVSTVFYLLVFILDNLEVDYVMKDDEEAVGELVINDFNGVLKSVLDAVVEYYIELEKQYIGYLKVEIGG
jgi:hypothetical protein